MDSLRADSHSDIDLSALAWVQDELRRSLEAAHKGLRRFVKEYQTVFDSDVAAVDPAVLRGVRQQLHQSVGALELVGLPAAARVLRASESVVQRFVAKPQRITEELADAIEGASFALLDYVARLLAGRSVSALAMFPQYRAVQEAAGADRVHPSDLWAQDWRWLELPTDTTAQPLVADARSRAALEEQLLALMRGGSAAERLQIAFARISQLCAGLGAGAGDPHAATLWKLAAAMFEAQSQGLLDSDVFTKRVASRLLPQLRLFEAGHGEASDRLAHELLFFCAQARSPGAGGAAPRLATVRQVYGLARHVPADYHTSGLGRFDPALIVQARKRVASAKEAWGAVAGGEVHRLGSISEQFALVGDSLRRLYADGRRLADELQTTVTETQHVSSAPPAPLAMEVATSLLYLDASLEDGDLDDPQQAERVRRLAERVAAVRGGQAPDPLEPWMEELYRRVSDRQTLGSVVHELRASLSESEKLIDQYFRNPADTQVLVPVPGQLSAMRGVLSVLGLDQASQAVLRMRDDVDALLATEVDPARAARTGTFDRLAGNLGALGFLIDMFSVQPQMAKSLFAFDAQRGTLDPLMGRPQASVTLGEPVPPPVEPRLLEQAQTLAFASARPDVPVAEITRGLERLSSEAEAGAQPELQAAVETAQSAFQAATDEAGVAAAREQLSEALVDFVHTRSGLMGLEPEPAAAPPAPLPVGELAQDDEMREIFLEEAREVLGSAREALAALHHEPAELEHLTGLRRAFHTLKGSARMVGLVEFGAAAWAGEQVFNTRLAEQRPADTALLAFTEQALGVLEPWVEALSSGASSEAFHAAAVQEAADAMSAPPVTILPAWSETTTEPAQSVSEVEEPQAFALPEVGELLPPDLPEAADLEFALRQDAQPAVASASAAPPDSAPLEFELELRALDAQPAAAPAGPPAEGPAHAFDMFATMPYPRGTLEAETPAPAVDERVEEGTDAMPRTVAPEPAAAQSGPVPLAAEEADEKRVGHLRIPIPLFNIYLNEADELSRRLGVDLAEWAMELHRPLGEDAAALAHSLAGSSATVGFADLSQLARALEHALLRAQARSHGDEGESRLYVEVAEEIRHLLHQFAAGFLKAPRSGLLERLAETEVEAERRQRAEEAAAEQAAAERTAAEEAEAERARAELARAGQLRSERVEAERAPAEQEAEAQRVGMAQEAEALRASAAHEAESEHARADQQAESERAEAIQKAEAERAAAQDAGVEAVDPASPAAEVAPPVEAAQTVPAPLSVLGDLPTGDSRFGGFGLTELKPLTDLVEPAPGSAPAAHDDDDESIDAIDAVDAELFPIFEEEGQELLPQLAARLRDWVRRPADEAAPAAAMRALHTLKGGARLAGAMRLGEMCHRLESRIERLLANPPAEAADLEALQTRGDVLLAAFEALRSRDAQAYAEASAAAVRSVEQVAAPAVPAPALAPVGEPEVPAMEAVATPSEAVQASESPASEMPEIDWSRFGSAAPEPTVADRATTPAAAASAVRVRAPLLDRMVNEAGEVSITRTRIESEVGLMRSSLNDLAENLDRLRQQLRELELQGETQMSSRMEAAKAAAQNFDPLEFDRFTRFQELTRMMAESVNDVATVQRTLQRAIDSAEDELAAQTRLTRDLQDDLLRTRMVEFESQSDRLYRVVRQAAKETGKQVRLDIVGGAIELDRGVLDRMTASFEHLLRNCVTHGIEDAAVRVAAGKDPVGTIVVALQHERNEVAVEFRDDGGGLDLQRIRAKGVALKLIPADGSPSDAELANLIFQPGFSTAASVTELAGRGVGMDVVRSDINAMGGRIETATAAGKGTSFKLVLPLTTAVTQIVMLRCGDLRVAVPASLVEVVQRAKPEQVERAYANGSYPLGDHPLPFFWLGALLQHSGRGTEGGRMRSVVVIRSAQQRVALHVDEVLGNQEAVVKNLGPQLSGLPGLVGMTLLASGAVALIYNPVALATLYGDTALALTRSSAEGGGATLVQPEPGAADAAPLVLVVDDSLTVRRVTQRLLVREGYRVVLAKDGLDALERLAEEKPKIVLSDIEMPRMDGFDLVRNLRADARLADLPVIMITSRIAQKHREVAAELGVDHYLGKPYSEEDLLALVGRYTASAAALPA